MSFMGSLPTPSLTGILASATDLEEAEIRAILARDPSHYRTFYIPKKNGGNRQICEPSPELKALQRALMKALEPLLPIHDAAFAYRPGRSIKDNARVHASNPAIKKFDFSDFFSSLTAADWEVYCQTRVPHWGADDISVSTRVFFNDTLEPGLWRLAMGAPSSPFVSNAMLAAFDEEVTDRLMPFEVVYTRYAD